MHAFCARRAQLLQEVNLAAAYSDPKTFVDKPTSKSSQDVLAAFSAITNTTITEGDIVNFLDTNFRGEGLELEAVALSNFNDNPAFLNNVSDPLVKAFSQTVHGYWTQLIRNTNQSALCPEGTESGPCESTLVPLNHTFVVPGGRFREQCMSFYSLESILPPNTLLVRLLGLVLDRPGSYQVRAFRHCQRHTRELHGRARELRLHSERWPHLLYVPYGFPQYPRADVTADLNRSQPPLFIHVRAYIYQRGRI